MAESEPDDEADFEISSKLKVKPFCKPDVHLKKTRQRIFNENSIDLVYSFGYQSSNGHNLCMLKENILIIVAGNHLNFLNMDTSSEDFISSINGASFTCVTVHPSTIFFAAAEKGAKFCINVFSYPALEVCKTLKENTGIMPTRAMKFHPQGDLLIALSCDPENKIYIWRWESETVLYISMDSDLFVYSMHFSSSKKDIFVTTGEEHVTFWKLSFTRNERDIITELNVSQQVQKSEQSPKLIITSTVSVSNTYLSATSKGYLLLWHPKLQKFSNVIKISLLRDKPCHEGSIWHIIIYNKYIVTFGSDGYMKFWNYDNIIEMLTNVEDGKETEEEQKCIAILEVDEESGTDKVTAIQTSPEIKYLVSETSDLVYGIITQVTFDDVSFVIQDGNGILFHVIFENNLSNISVSKLLSGLGSNIVGLVSCPVYPFIAAASSLGNIAVYDCVDKTVFKFGTFSVSITSIIWPSAKLDLFGTSFLVGFSDGSIKWIAFSEDLDNFILKFVLKTHMSSVDFMKMNETGTVLISQGSDSKLFFYCVENYSLIPLGYYINHHEVVDFTFLKYLVSSEEYYETLLVFCKYSYIIESAIPNSSVFKDSVDLRETYFIESEDYQVYRINGLRQYHELGDRIYDSDCEEIPDLTEAGKSGLRKLKYDEKREKRENRHLELGFSGPVTPPEILSYLSSAVSNHIWLSLGKEDFGYIFEFEFLGKFSKEPIDLVPIRALEILTAEIIPVLSMQYSPCGKIIFMGLEDGSLNLCYLDEAFMPSSGYDFAKFQLHDPEVGAVEYVQVSPEGSFIITAGCEGNILLFKFSMFEYQEIEDYEERPVLSDITAVEDIPAKKLSLEEEVKHKMNAKYHKMKENRRALLEKLRDEYSALKNEYSEYLNLCKSSLKKMADIPEELKINTEELTSSQIALKMFAETTNKLLKGIDARYKKDLIKSTLQYEKYFKFFKEKVEQEVITVKDDKENIYLSSFRSCELPSVIRDVQLSSYPSLFKPKEEDFLHEQMKIGKVWNERIKLEKQLNATRKALIEYPDDTPISDLISRFNKRKQEQIMRLREHVAEYEILENIVIDDKKYKETVDEIKGSQFHFKENADINNISSEHLYSFSEKKARTALYFKKIYMFWNNFNSLLLTALNYNKRDNEIPVTHTDVKENVIKDSSQIINSHIYYKMGKAFQSFRDSIKIDWNESEDDANMPDEKNINDNVLELKKETTLQLQEKGCNSFMSVLMAAKPRMNCEKKFCDIRFILKCIELNLFKLDLMKEKKWLKIINELKDLLHEENIEFSSLEEKMLLLKNKRQAEKDQWMNLYNQFRKTIGLQNKHKGYFKEIFKKKIRPEDEKGPYERHTSSESSESEQDIKSEDDIDDINPKDVDKDMLRKVMHFRLKRHEIEKRMKVYKRELLSLTTKQSALQKKIKKTGEALEESWKSLNTIPANRKLEIQNIIWPVVLYPENVHKDFFGKRTTATQKEKAMLYENMSQMNEAVLKELKPIDTLIKLTLIKVTDKVVKAELMDLIDIACVFFPLIDTISKEVDEYFMQINCPGSLKTAEEVDTSEEKSVNIIQEILFAAAKESELTEKDSEEEIDFLEDISSVKSDVSIREDTSIEAIEISEADYLDKLALDVSQTKVSVKSDANISLRKKKHTLKSWREVCDVTKDISSTKTDFKDLDINSFIVDVVPSLDNSLFVQDKHFLVTDYYMLPLSFEKTEEFQKKSSEQPDLTYGDFAKLLFDLDVSDILEDLVRKVAEEEESLKPGELSSDTIFPTYSDGGLFLTRDVLIEMQNEDPDNFPYTNFYQEVVGIEEEIEVPEIVHVAPHYKEIVLKYDLSSVPVQEFILMSIRDVLRSLKAYSNIKLSTLECEDQLRSIEKKLSKARSKRINVEQELFAISREKTEEMNKKFSRIMDLEHLQDIIENPHLRIRKYESEKKLDSLKKELKKLKAAEINALKSLDVLEYEDTITCHELLQLRQEFKFLNEKHLSKLRNFPQSGKKR